MQLIALQSEGSNGALHPIQSNKAFLPTQTKKLEPMAWLTWHETMHELGHDAAGAGARQRLNGRHPALLDGCIVIAERQLHGAVDERLVAGNRQVPGTITQLSGRCDGHHQQVVHAKWFIHAA
jgi:hypothetical protein